MINILIYAVAFCIAFLITLLLWKYWYQKPKHNTNPKDLWTCDICGMSYHSSDPYILAVMVTKHSERHL